MSNVSLQALGKRAAQGLVDRLRGQLETMPFYLSYQGQQMINLENKNLQLQVCKYSLLLSTPGSMYICNTLCYRCLAVPYAGTAACVFFGFLALQIRPLALHLKTWCRMYFDDLICLPVSHTFQHGLGISCSPML